MYRFLKTRWLLRQLRKDCFNYSKDSDMSILISGQTWMKRPIFVDFNAENRVFRYKRSDKARRKMVETLNSIIDECKNSNPQLIYYKEAGGKMPDGTTAPCEMIKTTGEGDKIAGLSDTFEDFVNKYKTILVIIWTTIGLVWVYLLREIAQDIWTWIANISIKFIIKLWNG